MENILKIKDIFSKLISGKIIKIYNITNNKKIKSKLKLNITTKSPSRKQVIMPISINNSNTIISQANIHISNINKLLKDVKSKVFANFICSDNREVIITTNNEVASLDLSMVNKYIKDLNNLGSNNIMSLWLSQSKSYLEILELHYYSKNMNLPITSDVIEEIIKNTRIFNDVVLVFWLYIIKMFLKSDIAVILLWT